MQVFVPLLTVLFIGLKLTGYIAWSWLWILSPLWITFILAVVWFLIVLSFPPKTRSSIPNIRGRF